MKFQVKREGEWGSDGLQSAVPLAFCQQMFIFIPGSEDGFPEYLKGANFRLSVKVNGAEMDSC